MKKIYVFATIILLACSVLLSGCITLNDVSEKTNDGQSKKENSTESDNPDSNTETKQNTESKKDDVNENESLVKTEDLLENTGIKKTFGRMGWAVDTEDAVYYWNFSGEDLNEGALFANFSQNGTSIELVRYKDGEESVVGDAKWASEFAVTNERVFFADDGYIKFVNHDSNSEETAVEGSISGITEDGKHLVYYSVAEDGTYQLCALDTITLETILLASKTEYVAIRDGIVYHTPYRNYDTPLGVISLYAANPETGENTFIYSTPAEEDEYALLSGGTSVAHIRFNDEYIYFSHGQIQGTGAFYSGGDIFRVRYDGSGAELLADNSEGFVDAEFTVNPDGSITQNDIGTGGLYNFRRKYTFDLEHNIIWLDETTGAPKTVCTLFPDDTYDMSTADFVNVTDKYVFFVTHHCTYNPEMNVGWRDYYEREKSIFYMVDRQTKEIVTSYEF